MACLVQLALVLHRLEGPDIGLLGNSNHMTPSRHTLLALVLVALVLHRLEGPDIGLLGNSNHLTPSRHKFLALCSLHLCYIGLSAQT